MRNQNVNEMDMSLFNDDDDELARIDRKYFDKWDFLKSTNNKRGGITKDLALKLLKITNNQYNYDPEAARHNARNIIAMFLDSEGHSDLVDTWNDTDRNLKYWRNL